MNGTLAAVGQLSMSVRDLITVPSLRYVAYDKSKSTVSYQLMTKAVLFNAETWTELLYKLTSSSASIGPVFNVPAEL